MKVEEKTKEDILGELHQRIIELEVLENKYRLAEEKIARDYQIQNAIISILRIALRPISLDEQLKQILDLILSIPWLSLQSKGCIYLVEDDPEMLVMKAQHSLSEALLATCRKVPFGRCLCGKAASTGMMIFTDHIDDLHETRYEGMLSHGHYNVPILSNGRVIGVINLYVKEGHKRDQGEEEFLLSAAHTLAGIIERKHIESERDHLRRQIIQSETLSALGRLTANVAHEIRNPLIALGGFARRLNKSISDGTREKEYTELIISEAERLENILRDVLTYSRSVSLRREKQNINEIVNESLKTYKEICREHSIRIEKLFSDLPQIEVDKNQVKEVMINLLSNAIYSMKSGGTMTIATEKELLNKTVYVIVKITDTGEGIPEDRLSMIFEPFFTTKDIGHGTGLGLSISRKIMEEHGGFIKVKSTMGKGSTFAMYFPYRSETEEKNTVHTICRLSKN